MSILNDMVPNQNNLQTTKFQMIFPRVTSAVYFLQRVGIPGLNTTPTKQNTPFVDVYRPGDKAEYDNLDMDIIVDEDLWSWEIIHDWIKGYTFPQNFDEYKELKLLSDYTMDSRTPQYSDGQLMILNALNNPKMLINFYQLFPVSISSVVFDTKGSVDDPIVFRASFRYSYYTVNRSV